MICLCVSVDLFSQNLNLNIFGSNNNETQVIDSLNYTKNHKDYISIKSEIDLVQNSLFKMGYIENKASAIKKKDSLFTVNIDLKKKITSIRIYYDALKIDNTILKLVSENISDTYFELSFTEIESALNTLNLKTSENGFPFSKLRLSNIQYKNNTNLEAELIVDSVNKKRTLNNIVIKGYKKFPLSYIKHYLKIKESQVFDLKTIKNKTKKLNDLRFANETKPPEVLFSKDSTDLYLYLKKTKSNTFDGFLGFGTNKETSKIEFDGFLNLNLTNNLNYGESFKLLYKTTENDQKTFETNLALPYLFRSPIGVDLSLQIFKRDSSFTTVTQAAKIHYQINSKNKIYSGLTSKESNNLLKEASLLSISNYNTRFYTFAYQFIKPQYHSLLFPINTSLYLETNFGKRKESNKQEKQTLISFDASKIFNLNKKNSFYLRINGSSLNSNSYFENELIQFGGINSIRGFKENSLFSTLFGLINTEYRYAVNNTIYIHSIFDTAYFENNISNIEEKLFGYGFGFGILTKSGLLKFNYANGKSEKQKFILSNSKIHLSLIANF